MQIPAWRFRPDIQMVYHILLITALILTIIHITLLLTSPGEGGELSSDTALRQGMNHGGIVTNQGGNSNELYNGRGAGAHLKESGANS